MLIFEKIDKFFKMVRFVHHDGINASSSKVIRSSLRFPLSVPLTVRSSFFFCASICLIVHCFPFFRLDSSIAKEISCICPAAYALSVLRSVSSQTARCDMMMQSYPRLLCGTRTASSCSFQSHAPLPQGYLRTGTSMNSPARLPHDGLGPTINDILAASPSRRCSIHAAIIVKGFPAPTAVPAAFPPRRTLAIAFSGALRSLHFGFIPGKCQVCAVILPAGGYVECLIVISTYFCRRPDP